MTPDRFAFPAADGYRLAATAFAPAAPNGAAVAIAGGTGIPRRFYAKYAADLAARGYAVITFDYRGVGDSAPARMRGFAARMSDWGRLDIDAALASARSRFAPRRLFVVAHSAGGQLLGLAPAACGIDGAVFVSSQSGYWRYWTGRDRLRLLVLWRALIPAACAVVGHYPKALGLGEALPAGVARQWARWGRDPRYLFGDTSLDLANYQRFDRPLLALSFADDAAYAPRRAVEALLREYPAAHAEHRAVDPAARGLPRIGHFGFFRETARPLWDETAAWLEARLIPAGS